MNSPPSPPPEPHPESGLPPEAHAWLAEHPETEPSELEEVWRLTEYAQPPEAAFAPDPARVAAMRARIVSVTTGEMPAHSPPPPAKARPPRRLVLIRTIPRTWAVAASIALLAVVGTALWLRPITHAAPVGERLTTTLPDGSLITLNSGTTLTYRRTFGWRTRAIRLEGEAFFDVTASAKVFRVHTFNSAVTVLGTRFNVRAWAQDPTDKTTVVLEEGRVRFAANAAPQQGVVLQPGQMSRVVGDAATPTVPVEVPVDRLMAWRTGGMAFTDQSIGDILAEVERRFGVDVRTTPDSIRDERLSLFLNSVDDVETVLAAICSPRGYRFQATDTGYTLTE